MSSLLDALSCADDYDPDSLPVERARQLILSLLAPVPGEERLFVRQALDRILAQDVIAPLSVPAHDNSAMDGYAVRAADLNPAGETTLKQVGTAFAGHPFAATLGPGEAVRIMTGAVVPAGADTIVIQEVVRLADGQVIVPAGQRQGQNVRHAGEDLRAGEVALPAGKLLRPAEIGLLASLGQAEVSVHRRLRVAMFSTGDELASLGEVLQTGEIYDSNRYSMWGMLTRLGCEVIDMGVVRDDPAALEAALVEAAQHADAIVTSGGVSVGDADFIRELMARLGEVAFWKIAMKPGRPMAFGKIRRPGHGGAGAGKPTTESAWLFGLPGNPVAVMASFYQFVRPALLKMMGVPDAQTMLPTMRVPCAMPIRKGRGRTEFQRGTLYQENGEWRVKATGAQGSGILRSMSQANCFIVLDTESTGAAAGELVNVQLMDGLV
ncbi:MAG: molybdopterin molybdotransferase MoeA [Sterolibacterium sp.]|nr:molybdopterin molybdotransferase MoeA [Sterolibacterium sp.]